MFQQAGYRIKILNTINFSKSMKYNPFVYIHSEKDVLKLVNTLIANTKGEGEKSAEDFWVKSERLFYTALIGYIWYEAPAEEMNFTTLLEIKRTGRLAGIDFRHIPSSENADQQPQNGKCHAAGTAHARRKAAEVFAGIQRPA